MKTAFGWICIVFALWSGLAAQEAPRLGKAPLEEVVAAMTLEEKALIVVGSGMNFPGLPDEMKGPEVGETEEKVEGAAGTTHAIARLGIPSMVLADGPAGLRIQPFRGDSSVSYYCTAFPIATLLASSWNTGLVEKVGRAMGNEVKEYGVDVILGPALNLHRNPLGGRNFEYYSEDPVITGKMAAAMVRGIESQGVGTSIKHFVANNHEWNRNVINVKVDQRTLRELYLRGFEIAVRESQPWTVMTSYNKVNGTYTSESEDLVTKILRDDWGFKGLVMTDWNGGRDAVAQMKAGNDLLMPGTSRQMTAIMDAVRSGVLDESVLDRNVKHILNVALMSPALMHYANSDKPDLKAHALVCREAGAEGMVLLKNNGDALPLKSGCSTAVFGNAAYEMITGGTGSGDVNEAYSVSLIEGLTRAGYAVDETVSEAYLTYLAEQKANRPKPRAFRLPPPVPERAAVPEEIAKAAAAADLALITIGRNSGEFMDRKQEDDFYLSVTEMNLISAVCEAFHGKDKKVVVVLNIGGVIETASWRELPDAILLAWQPGQEAGNSAADILSGRVNPSGRLADTFPVNYMDVPSSSNFPGTVLEGPDPSAPAWMRGARAAEVVYEDSLNVGYRYYTTQGVETAYPFGFGLSYTTFEYEKAKLSTETFTESMQVTVPVKNTGHRPGKTVIQLYIHAPGKALPKPERELKAFAKTVLLKPGEGEMVILKLTAKDLASFDTAQSAWVVEAGEYTLSIGLNAEKMLQSAAFSVPEALIVEKTSHALKPKAE